MKRLLQPGVGVAVPYSSATANHSCILIRLSPESAKDKIGIQLLFD